MTTNTFVAAGTARQPQRLVVGTGDTLDECQDAQQWVASDTVMEVRR